MICKWYLAYCKYRSWYFKIASNFTNLITAREITYNNFEMSLVVFMPNITTNHAITYTYNSCIIGCHGKVYNTVWECGQILILSHFFCKNSLHLGYIRASWTMATSFPRFVYYGSCIIGKIVNCQANVITLFWECGQIIIQLQGAKNLNRSQIVSGLLECFLNRFSKQKCLSFLFFKPVQLTYKLCLLNKKHGISCLISKKRHLFRFFFCLILNKKAAH